MKLPLSLRIFFFFYRLLWLLATPILVRTSRLKEGADERLLNTVSFAKVDLWIHAASVGEAYIARQIVSSFPEKHSLDILITTNTSQGKEILARDIQTLQQNVTIAYMVFDNPVLVKKALQISRPELLVLIELEIWPALMAEMKKMRKKIIIVNGRMTKRSFKGYSKTSFLWRHLKPDTILAISNDDKQRLATLFGQKNSHVVANIKFDIIHTCQVEQPAHQHRQSIVFASIRKKEETDVLHIIKELLNTFPDLRINLFPRHLHRVQPWGKRLKTNRISYVLKTASTASHSPSVVLWDVFGKLNAAYSEADAAFVGGSLADLGGQNFLEAFMNGVIPVTGPYISDFSWTGQDVQDCGLLHIGNNREKVLELLIKLLKNPPDRETVRHRADKYIRLKQGGSGKTCQHIVKVLQVSDADNVLASSPERSERK